MKDVRYAGPLLATMLLLVACGRRRSPRSLRRVDGFLIRPVTSVDPPMLEPDSGCGCAIER